MRFIPILILGALGFTPLLLSAQENGDDINPRAKKIHQKAQKYFFRKDFESAAKLYKRAIKKDSSYIKAYMNLSRSYFKTNQHQKRRGILKKVLARKPEFKDPYFNLATDYFVHSLYKEAIPYFEKFLEFQGVDDHYRDVAKKKLKKAKMRARLMDNPVDFNPKNLGPEVNTEKDEYWPAQTVDRQTLYFTRELIRDPNAQGVLKYNEDIFTSKKSSDGSWKPSQKVRGQLNSRKYNEGAITIAPNGDYIIFTGCQWPDVKGRCDLYISQKTPNGWTDPENLGKPINTPAKETQPSIAYDGNTLYFASDRNSGRDNLNIWKSERQEDGTWGEPEGLGKPINNGESQQSPFIHADNETLYFASEGHKGMGKFDLYYSRKDSTGEFQEPGNLGYPINDEGNDLGLFVSSDGRTAFFSSEKEEGEGGMDIYQFTLPEYARPQPVTYVKGKIEDAVTYQNLEANVKLKALESAEVAVRTQSDKQEGTFLVPLHSDKNYGLNITKKGYIFHSEHLPIKKYDSAKPFEFEVKLEPIQKGKKAILNNIFFEFDSHKLKETSKADLEELIDFMNANPGIKIQIQGHTDNKGSESYNEKLSEKRAKSVYDYLIDQGAIAENRLGYKGFGESEPIETNETDEGRAQNRRTEFKIIGVDQ